MRFAITVPVGHYHPLLDTCLRSLAAQTEEVAVALLDASRDPRVSEVADRYPDLFAYRHHGPDKGQADAIARGWEMVEGDVLGWLNADDRLYPDALSKAREALDSSDVVYGHSTIIDGASRITGWQYGVEPPSPRLAHASVISQPSCFFKRSAHDAAGGINRDLHYTMDWDLFVRLHESGARFSFIDEALSQVLWSDETKTASLNKARRSEINRMLKQHRGDVHPVKSFIGFALQHVIDGAPPRMGAFLRRRLMGDRPRIFGLGADGRMDTRMHLPLCHYGDTAMSSVQLRFSAVPAGIRLEALGKELALECNAAEGLVRAHLPGPLAPATTLTLSVSVAPDQACTFSSAELVAPEA